MQKVPLETQINVALAILKKLKNDISFDDILAQVDQSIKEFDLDFKQSDLILLMKYISYYELLNNTPVPSYFVKNNKKPISSEKGAMIESLITNFDPDDFVLKKELVDVKKYSEEVFTETENQNDEDDELEFNPLFFKKVDELELSVRSVNCLKNGNIVYIGDLVQITEAAMLRIQNFGISSLYEIKELLSSMCLHLGTDIGDWPPNNIEELAKKHQNLPTSKNESIETLSNEKLEVIFCKISAVNFSSRLKNVLMNSQIEAVGQILLSENLKCLGINARANLPNYGKNSLVELKEFIKQHGLESISLFEWPSSDQIKSLIKSRKLIVGRCFAITPKSETIEGEARDILGDIVSDTHKEGIFKRLGLEDECIPWTLQEVGNEGFENGVPITRERVRQIQARYVRKLKHVHFLSPKCDAVSSYIRNSPFVSESLLKEYLENKNLTTASDPISLVLRLRDYWFCYFNHEIIEIKLLNSRFLVKQEYVDDFRNFAKILRKKMYGVNFLKLKPLIVEAVQEDNCEDFFICLLKNLDYFKNIVVCKKEEEVFIAKRAFRLGSSGTIGRNGPNTLVSTMALIFSICSFVNLRILHKAISRDRKIREKISLEFLIKYLEACPFIKLEGEKVICTKRPGFGGKITHDFKILDFALETGSTILDSTQLVRGLVQKGLSENSASVLRTVTPFLVSLKKGNFRTKGIFRLICELEDLDILSYREDESSSNQLLGSDQKFKISNNPPLRATGRALVPELEIDEGDYQVYDDEDNYLKDVQVRGKMILGLKELALKNTDTEFNLSFSGDRFLYS